MHIKTVRDTESHRFPVNRQVPPDWSEFFWESFLPAPGALPSDLKGALVPACALRATSTTG
jgi:hypothetical protein